MIDQPDAQAFVFDPGVELSSIVDTMNGVGATPPIWWLFWRP